MDYKRGAKYMTKGMMLYYGGVTGIGLSIILTLVFVITAVYKKRKENELYQMEHEQLLRDMKQISNDLFSINANAINLDETELLGTLTMNDNDKTVTLYRQSEK